MRPPPSYAGAATYGSVETTRSSGTKWPENRASTVPVALQATMRNGRTASVSLSAASSSAHTSVPSALRDVAYSRSIRPQPVTHGTVPSSSHPPSTRAAVSCAGSRMPPSATPARVRPAHKFREILIAQRRVR